MTDLISTVTSVIGSLLFLLIFISIGWYIVWWCFLSRFKFVREILYSGREASPNAVELKRVRQRTCRRVRRD